jgi:hypothetical protein
MKDGHACRQRADQRENDRKRYLGGLIVQEIGVPHEKQ